MAAAMSAVLAWYGGGAVPYRWFPATALLTLACLCPQ